MVAYNVQTAVDSEMHLIDDYQLTNQVTDYGMIKSTGTREAGRRKELLGVIADKGYNERHDMEESLEAGIIPHVIIPDGQDTYELEMVMRRAGFQKRKQKDMNRRPEGMPACRYCP